MAEALTSRAPNSRRHQNSRSFRVDEISAVTWDIIPLRPSVGIPEPTCSIRFFIAVVLASVQVAQGRPIRGRAAPKLALSATDVNTCRRKCVFCRHIVQLRRIRSGLNAPAFREETTRPPALCRTGGLQTRRPYGAYFYGICSTRVLFGVVLPTFTRITSRSLAPPV